MASASNINEIMEEFIEYAKWDGIADAVIIAMGSLPLNNYDILYQYLDKHYSATIIAIANIKRTQDIKIPVLHDFEGSPEYKIAYLFLLGFEPQIEVAKYLESLFIHETVEIQSMMLNLMFKTKLISLL